ncbi:hypothetical protein LCGC14_1755170 [marine sediment metagenome]|uniref:Right handed beta helix domain-containing protein n=1 Tax=marine sediment metagenome TaxID=412755 RepID=A0A0F9HQ41_9ZZZZ
MLTTFSGPVMSHGGFIGGEGPSGRTFFVNANAGGADDVDVDWWSVDEDTVFSTLQAAINKCVANRGDTIYVKQGGELVTSTVLFNKAGIRVIVQRLGMAPSMRGEFTSIYSTSLTGDPTAIISQPCYIEGLGFVGADAGTLFFEGAALLLRVDATSTATTKPWGVHLNQCRFPGWNLGNTCGLAMDGGTNVLIDDCYFEDAAFTHGIYMQGAVGHVQISNSHFSLGTYAIKCGSFSDAGVNTQLEIGPGNVTVAPTRGVNSGSNAAKVTIFRNSWATAVNSTHDQSIDDMESDGYICVGNEYADEESDDE